MNKKYILIGGGLVLILGGLAYYFYSKKQIEDLKTQSDTGGGEPRQATNVRKSMTTYTGKTAQAMPTDLKNLKSRTLGR